MEWLIIAPIAGLVSIAFAIYLYFYVEKQDSGNARMQEISLAIKDGANAYLKRQNKTLAVFVAVIAIVLGVVFRDYKMALAYVIGSIFSALAGYFGLNVAVKANVRTTSAAEKVLTRLFPWLSTGVQ